MQALSQLSYGPTLLLARHYSGFLSNWKLFILPCNLLGGLLRQKKTRYGWVRLYLMNGVPTGIRTPVATVKG